MLVTLAGNHVPLPQISEMLRNDDLRLSEDLLDVADAQRGFAEQAQDAQPGLITEAFVDRDQFHARNISICLYK